LGRFLRSRIGHQALQRVQAADDPAEVIELTPERAD
jgi:hypothetical protein